MSDAPVAGGGERLPKRPPATGASNIKRFRGFTISIGYSAGATTHGWFANVITDGFFGPNRFLVTHPDGSFFNHRQSALNSAKGAITRRLKHGRWFLPNPQPTSAAA